LVYLGVVLRSNNSNGKVYVKPQNGFEIEELHRVYAKNASTNDTLMYNSGSGSWFARQINTGDVSGIFYNDRPLRIFIDDFGIDLYCLVVNK
jgi:hypothetical protein